jgi:histidine triad (HIT) family protein
MNDTTEPSIFTKIINGEIPCHKVYEDDKTIAFMDICPVQTGQVVIATKVQVADFLDLTPEDSEALWKTINIVGAKLRAEFPSKKRIGLMIEGLDVDHAHAKLFPVDTGEEYRADPPTSEPDHAALAALAKRLVLY